MNKPASFRMESSRTRQTEWARTKQRSSTDILRILGQVVIGGHTGVLAEAEVSCFYETHEIPILLSDLLCRLF